MLKAIIMETSATFSASGLSPLSFNQPSSWIGWRGVEDTSWRVLSHLRRTGKKSFPVLLLFDFPESVNGWIMAKQKKETKKIILKSVLSNRGNTPHFWWCGSKTPSSPLSLADLPLIKASYDGAKQVTPLGEVLSLLGTAIIDGGLFALWKKRCNSRLDCGRKSQHYPKNQTPPSRRPRSP